MNRLPAVLVALGASAALSLGSLAPAAAAPPGVSPPTVAAPPGTSPSAPPLSSDASASPRFFVETGVQARPAPPSTTGTASKYSASRIKVTLTARNVTNGKGDRRHVVDLAVQIPDFDGLGPSLRWSGTLKVTAPNGMSYTRAVSQTGAGVWRLTLYSRNIRSGTCKVVFVGGQGSAYRYVSPYDSISETLPSVSTTYKLLEPRKASSVSIKASRTTVKPGVRVKLSGKAVYRPLFVPAKALRNWKVTIYCRTAGATKYRLCATTRTNSSGLWARTVTVKKSTAYRVVVAATKTVKSSARTMVVKVRR